MRFQPTDPLNGVSNQGTSMTQEGNSDNGFGGSVQARQTQSTDKNSIFRSSNRLISVTAGDGDSIDADAASGQNFVIVVSGK
jgi:hypothetical protein